MKLTTKHVAIIAFSIIGFVVVHHYFFELRTIKEKGIYSIGFVTDFQYRARTSVCYYHFYYHGIKYDGGNLDAVFTTGDVGKRFFVQFLKDDPERCVLLRKEVPVCILEASPEGWEIIPHCMDEDGNLH
jgi:hypothetical protein